MLLACYGPNTMSNYPSHNLLAECQVGSIQLITRGIAPSCTFDLYSLTLTFQGLITTTYI